MLDFACISLSRPARRPWDVIRMTTGGGSGGGPSYGSGYNPKSKRTRQPNWDEAVAN